MKHEYDSQIISLEGRFTFTKACIETPEQWYIANRIRFLEERLNTKDDNGVSREEYVSLIRELNRVCSTEVYEEKNLLPTEGRAVIANNLTSGSPNNDPQINYTALGTDSTAPANSDTSLVSESFRKTVASSTHSDHVAYVTAFYTADDTNGTFKEHGLFIDATATTDSGKLFSRVLLNNGNGISKSTTETLTIDYTLTIS